MQSSAQEKKRKDIEKSQFPLVDPVQLYFVEINRYGLLTREEEKELAIRVREKNDSEAAHKLVTSNLRLVVKIAMDFKRHWIKNVLDLIQEGNLGLIKAVKKFDPYRGIKFSYYASFWIRAYMLKFIMDNWKLVKIGTTQNQRKLFFKLAKERDRLLARGREPQPKLLAERLNVREQDVVEMTERLGSWEVSLNAPMTEDSGGEYSDIIPAPGPTPDEQVSEKDGKEILSIEIKRFREGLPAREADIFDNRIMAENPKTLQQLGSKYGISRERVRQLEGKIVTNAERWFKKEIPHFEEDYAGAAGG